LICSSPLPEVFRQATASGGYVTVASVPALWRAWHEAGAITPVIRLAISAGAPLPVQLEGDVFNSTGLKIHNFYGSSECGGIAYDAGEFPRTDDSFAGTPMRGVKLSTRADGCLVVESPAVGLECGATVPNPDGEYFVTSDLGEMDGAQVHLRGRAGDVMNIAGRKLSPGVVESALLRHPAVRECVVFGVPSGDAGRVDEIAACIVAKPGTTPEALRQFLAGQLDAWQLPRHWRFVETLEAGPRGKVSRAGWRAMFAGESAPPA
jgi:long-chain acyl-CoA synthetase